MLGLSFIATKVAGLVIFADVVKPGASCDLTNPTIFKTFFIIPPWWEYLSGKYDQLLQCSPDFHFPTDILPVGLAVLDMLLRLAGFLAVVSIIIAGVEYITAAGNIDKITNARRRWINALIGLSIALVATAAVSFIGRKLVEG